MTLQQAKQEAKKLGYTITKKGDEYRLNIIGGTEAEAYYTDDLQDAIETCRLDSRYRVNLAG